MKVYFVTTQFEQSHQKGPRGRGSWVFRLTGVSDEILFRLQASRIEVHPKCVSTHVADTRLSSIERAIYDPRDVQLWCIGKYGDVRDLVRRVLFHALLDLAPPCLEVEVIVEP